MCSHLCCAFMPLKFQVVLKKGLFENWDNHFTKSLGGINKKS